MFLLAGLVMCCSDREPRVGRMELAGGTLGDILWQKSTRKFEKWKARETERHTERWKRGFYSHDKQDASLQTTRGEQKGKSLS